MILESTCTCSLFHSFPPFKMPVICAEMLVGFKLISELRYVLRLSAAGAVNVVAMEFDEIPDVFGGNAGGAVVVVVVVSSNLSGLMAVGSITIEFVALVCSCTTCRSVIVVIVMVSTT